MKPKEKRVKNHRRSTTSAEAFSRVGVRAVAASSVDPAAMGKKSLDSLMRDLADPDVPAKSLIPYLTTKPMPGGGLEPVLLPNEDTVDTQSPAAAQARARGDIGLGFLNSVFRSRRLRLFERRLADGDPRPVLLAEGDSWFQYPVFLDDVVDHLSDDYTILCLSGAGEELRTMVDEAEYRDYLREMSNRTNFRGMLFSAGGNDVVGSQMRSLLRDHDPGLNAVGHINATAWTAKLATLVAGYEAMIAAVHGVLPGLPILFHGYDHANPLPAQGFNIPPLDGWVGEPMRSRGIADGPLQAAIVRAMIDDVNQALMPLAGGNRPGGKHPRVYFVDNRGIVANRWHDELHPLDAGFRDVARNFRKVMQQDAGLP